jgi:chlorinating enzyme
MRKFIRRKLILPVLFLISRLKFLYPILPDRILMILPQSWTWKMIWTTLKFDGRNYVDIPCILKDPESFKPKVKPDDEQYQMTEEDIRSFYEKGYTKPYTIYQPEEMDEIREHVRHLMHDTTSTIYPPNFYEYTGKKESKETYDNKEMSNEALARKGINSRDRHLDDPVMLKILTHPAVVERCAQLLGPDLLVWRSQYFQKDPQTLGTAFHQAAVYLLDNMRTSSLEPVDINKLFQLTVWVALTDCRVENGCMTVIPGSHREIRPVIATTYDPNRKGGQRFGAKDIRIDYPIETSQIDTIEMKAGQYFIFSERVIHGSHPNTTTDQDRIAVNCRYITPESQIYRPHLFKYGNQFRLLNLKNIRLDNWKAVLVRGEDRFKKNGDRVIPKETILQELEKTS